MNLWEIKRIVKSARMKVLKMSRKQRVWRKKNYRKMKKIWVNMMMMMRKVTITFISNLKGDLKKETIKDSHFQKILAKFVIVVSVDFHLSTLNFHQLRLHSSLFLDQFCWMFSLRSFLKQTTTRISLKM